MLFATLTLLSATCNMHVTVLSQREDAREADKVESFK